MALVASLALTAFAASSASALTLVNQNGEPTSTNFPLSGGGATISLAGNGAYGCTGSGGTGTFAKDGTTGQVQLSFQGCTLLGSYCTTSGQAAGTIRTAALSSKLVYLDAAKTKFGLLLTPPASTPFAECNAAFGTVRWTGSLIGQITKPALNVSSNTGTLQFAGISGNQSFQQIEGAGPLYHLSHSINGGASTAMAITNTQNFSYAGGAFLKYIP